MQASRLGDQEDFGIFLGDHEEFEGGGGRKTGLPQSHREHRGKSRTRGNGKAESNLEKRKSEFTTEGTGDTEKKGRVKVRSEK
jgi:hypothetical protein